MPTEPLPPSPALAAGRERRSPWAPIAATLTTTLATTLVAAAWQAWLIGRAVGRGRRLAAASAAFESHPARARARVLVLGDSTGVGVGADVAEESLAGLLAERFPGTEVLNRAFSGARLRDLLAPAEQLAADGARFDLVLLLVGGNDVLRHTPHRQLAAEARRLLRSLARIARRTVWLGCGDIGRSPAFVPPLSWWLSRRTVRTMRLLAREAAAHGADFIDFSRAPPAAALPFATDGVHPSSASYRRCFAVLQQRAPLAALLRREPEAGGRRRAAAARCAGSRESLARPAGIEPAT